MTGSHVCSVKYCTLSEIRSASPSLGFSGVTDVAQHSLHPAIWNYGTDMVKSRREQFSDRSPGTKTCSFRPETSPNPSFARAKNKKTRAETGLSPFFGGGHLGEDCKNRVSSPVDPYPRQESTELLQPRKLGRLMWAFLAET